MSDMYNCIMESDAPSRLYKAVFERSFSDEHCFLCGQKVTQKSLTREHVIPTWAQNSYELWDQKLYLLNGTTILYRQLTIPACYECNNKVLQPIETKVADAVAQGVKAVQTLDKLTLFQWLGKIFYGILYKELFLAFDRSSPESEAITSPELLNEFQMHHFFLQSLRRPIIFDGFFPASLLIFKTKSPDDVRYQWDFGDGLNNMFISCRMSDVGIIAVLQDGGAQQYDDDFWDKYRDMALHPVQFQEIATCVSYKAALFNRVPKYIWFEEEGKETLKVYQMPLAGLSKKPLFDEWKSNVYAQLLADRLDVPLSSIFVPPDSVMTWLHNEDGTIKEIDFNTFPWPPVQHKY